jgi:endonuclease III
MAATSGGNGAAALLDVYLTAKEAVVARGFAWEIDWQADRRLDRIDESGFLRESAWTVLSTGFREAVVRRLFVPICDAFLGMRSAAVIQANRARCRRAALKVFNHRRKVNAILDIASIVHEMGFERVRRQIEQEKVRFLQTLPYIGSITAFHLAKNLGLPVVKPDRHLQRIAAAAGFRSPQELCQLISDHLGEPVQVVDVVLWRYATLFSDYVMVFTASRDCAYSRGRLS